MVDSTCKTCTKSTDENNSDIEICNNNDLNKCKFKYERPGDSKKGQSKNEIDVDMNEAYSINNNNRCWGSYNNNSKKMMGLNLCGSKWCCRVSKYEVPHIRNNKLKKGFFDKCLKISDQKDSNTNLFPSENCSKTWDENKILTSKLETLCQENSDPSFPTSEEFKNLCNQLKCCSSI